MLMIWSGTKQNAYFSLLHRIDTSTTNEQEQPIPIHMLNVKCYQRVNFRRNNRIVKKSITNVAEKKSFWSLVCFMVLFLGKIPLWNYNFGIDSIYVSSEMHQGNKKSINRCIDERRSAHYFYHVEQFEIFFN